MYVKQEWENGRTGTPATAERMEHIEEGIYENSKAINGESSSKKTYSLKGLTITVGKKGYMATLSITGGLTEELNKDTFYDITLDSIFKPEIEINDTFYLLNGGGMIRVTTDGTFRLYPWVALSSGAGIRYAITYVTQGVLSNTSTPSVSTMSLEDEES